MTVKAIIDTIRMDGGSWIVIILLVMTFIQVSPIKIDPWSFIFKWFGNQINGDLYNRMNEIETKLDKHITESEMRDIRNIRTTILNFANSCMNKQRHTKEEFDFIISECDKYEAYCTENNIPNGVAEISMKEIKRIYEKCRQNNSFLIEGEEVT